MKSQKFCIKKSVCELNVPKSTIHRVMRSRRILKFTGNRLEILHTLKSFYNLMQYGFAVVILNENKLYLNFISCIVCL